MAQLLYPMFTHLYLELICTGQMVIAQKFHKRHHTTFLGNAEFAKFIHQLSQVLTPEAVASDEAVAAFQANKYSVTLSNQTYHYLNRYLLQGCTQTPILLQILTQKIDLKLADALGACSKSEAVKRIEKVRCRHFHFQPFLVVLMHISRSLQDQEEAAASVSSPDATTMGMGMTNDEDVSEATLKHLRETIQSVREGPAPLPTTCLYRLTDRDGGRGFVSSRVSDDAKQFVATAEDSAVYVWNLFPSKDNASTRTRNEQHQRVQLGCDDFRTFDLDPGDGESEEAKSEKCEARSMPEENQLGTGSGDLKTLRGHSGPVYEAAFLPSASNHLLSCSEDTTMRIWNLDTLENRAIYQGHSYPVWCLDVDALGVNVVTGKIQLLFLKKISFASVLFVLTQGRWIERQSCGTSSTPTLSGSLPATKRTWM